MERREFLTKCGAGLAGIIAAGKAPATIVKSLVGAQGTDFISSGWKNPYVTDGLIALFDGQWNIGGGKHEASRIITNLVTGENISLDTASSPENVTLGDNYIEVVKPCYLAVPSLTKALAEPATRTFEIVFKNISLNMTAQWCRVGWIDCGVVINFASTNHAAQLAYLSRLSNNQYISKLSNSYAYKNTMYTASAVTMDKNEGRLAYTNASEITLMSTNYSASVSQISFALFNFSGSATANTKSQIYTIRCYDRALTTDEIAFNYKVDRKRFNF